MPSRNVAGPGAGNGTGAPAPEPAAYFDDRESFKVAEAVLAVIGQFCGELSDDESAWEAFIPVA